MTIRQLATLSLCFIFLSMNACASNEEGDVYINGYTSQVALKSSRKPHFFDSQTNYTVLDRSQYEQTFHTTRQKISALISNLRHYHYQSLNDQIEFLGGKLSNIPYIYIGAMGEGDWQSASSVYIPDGIHVKQDPVYRLDGLDCQTFVQVMLGLLHAHTLNEFDQNILKIAYGAALNPQGGIVHYYNRNNFPDADFNPINEQNGYLTDITSQGILAPYASSISAEITRQNWFTKQIAAGNSVRVLDAANGLSMVQRFDTVYATLNYPNFISQTIIMSYIPKETIALKQTDGSYQPNQSLLDKIPTPALVEIVRDPKKWNIKALIGSELTISHLGFLYRKTFHAGDTIYQKVSCDYNDQHEKICVVSPVSCQQNICNELMFLHATDARPMGYYWYQQNNGSYACTKNPPANGTYTTCNRVTEQPFFNYLTEYQYENYSYMNNPSIVGVHIDQLK